MSSFCGGTGSVPAMTPSEIAEKFPNGFLPESLPPMENARDKPGHDCGLKGDRRLTADNPAPARCRKSR